MNTLAYYVVKPKTIVKEYEDPSTRYYVIKIGIPTDLLDKEHKGVFTKEIKRLKKDYLIDNELKEIEKRKKYLLNIKQTGEDYE